MSLYDPPPLPRRSWLRLLLVLAGCGLLLLGIAWYTRPDGYLHVFFLDTPGDAVLIQTPGGGYVLVDGGADPTELALHLGRRMPFWQRTLDAVVLTQADERRLPGQVAALARYRADIALTAYPLEPNDTTREWARLLEEQGTAVHRAQAGSRLDLDGATLTVLAAGAGLALRLDYGATSIMLLGAGSADDPALLADARPVTVLAYPWQRELSASLLTALQPQAIVFTSGYQAEQPTLLTFHERTFGNSALYERLYHPQIDGTIDVVSDGRSVLIHREHER
jgi:beta-lactamase superfamily II metal-dependent hydrolase